MSAKQENHEAGFSPSPLDLCIWWGKEHLLHGPSSETDAIEELFSKPGATSDGSLISLLAMVESRIEEALDELNDELTLDLNPDEARAHEYGLLAHKEDNEDTDPDFFAVIARYLQDLDSIIFLNHAVRHFQPLKECHDLRERVDLLVCKILENCPPAHRLIPLNPMRLSSLDGLPQEVHYLFPWYTQWSDLPADTFHFLAESLAGYTVSEIEERDLQSFWREVQEDAPLCEQILEAATIIRHQHAAMKQAYALRWLLAAKEIEAEGVMPNIVVKAGMVGAAIRVTTNAIISEVSPLEWRFRAGFCGLGLTDEQRLKLLKSIELSIKETGMAHWDGSSHLIAQWIKKEISDAKLAENIFKGWIHDLEQAAQRGFNPFFAEEAVLWLLLTADNPIPLATAIHNLDNAQTTETQQIYEKELTSICAASENHENSPDPFSLTGERDGEEETKREELVYHPGRSYQTGSADETSFDKLLADIKRTRPGFLILPEEKDTRVEKKDYPDFETIEKSIPSELARRWLAAGDTGMRPARKIIGALILEYEKELKGFLFCDIVLTYASDNVQPLTVSGQLACDELLRFPGVLRVECFYPASEGAIKASPLQFFREKRVFTATFPELRKFEENLLLFIMKFGVGKKDE